MMEGNFWHIAVPILFGSAVIAHTIEKGLRHLANRIDNSSRLLGEISAKLDRLR
jgi:hypothetical protein